jgi:hypothetical protein
MNAEKPTLAIALKTLWGATEFPVQLFHLLLHVLSNPAMLLIAAAV